jgi:putative alpha-1,2-mannosidase
VRRIKAPTQFAAPGYLPKTTLPFGVVILAQPDTTAAQGFLYSSAEFQHSLGKSAQAP